MQLSMNKSVYLYPRPTPVVQKLGHQNNSLDTITFCFKWKQRLSLCSMSALKTSLFYFFSPPSNSISRSAKTVPRLQLFCGLCLFLSTHTHQTNPSSTFQSDTSRKYHNDFTKLFQYLQYLMLIQWNVYNDNNE